MLILGIDPGSSPALAFLDADGRKPTRTLRIPADGHHPHMRALRRAIMESKPDMAIVELVGAMPGQGIASTAHFMLSCGIILGVLTGLRVPFMRVTPQTWKKALFTESEIGAHIEDRAKRKKHQKESAVRLVSRHLPSVRLVAPRCRTPDHNVAEACCLALWGRDNATLA